MTFIEQRLWEDNMTTFRGFIAIDINATPNILKFLKDITNSNADVKLVEPQNIHITLKFLGDVPEDKINDIEQIMKYSVKEIEPFTIKLSETGVFPNQNYIKVIWIGIKDTETIETIARSIDERLSQLGFKKEKRGFSAHLTIGRVKTAKNKQLLLKAIEDYKDFEFSTQDVNSIKLKKSDLTPKGPIYTTLKEVKL
ncbi:2''-5'' RNA ligase [Thermoplasmatales archaeon SCGC AB-540-F20]|nr:2''-5'' RNA ligase [Thermoplasmatales archaeon SCGC AB-540-F20]